MQRIFETSNFEMRELLLLIQAEAKTKVQAGKTLIILDEIQECPAALTSLKYFCEGLPDYHVMSAGSLLGVKTPRYRFSGRQSQHNDPVSFEFCKIPVCLGQRL